LTALSKLAPHLTQANAESVLAECERQPPEERDLEDIHFKAPQAFTEKLRKSKALLSHKYPKGHLADIFGEALDELIKTLEPKLPKRTPRKKTDSTPSRHIPQILRAQVYKRDGGKCTYVSPNGHKCESRHFLEFEHNFPWALGGEHDLKNVRLLCRTHNALMADRFFGTSFMRNKVHPELCTAKIG